MEQKELHGGSYHWWPPTEDHIFLYKLNPVRFEHFDRFLDGWDGVKVLDVGCGGGYAFNFWPKGPMSGLFLSLLPI